MKCKRCGHEMKIKPIEVGKDKQGNPIYNAYAFCYDCKIKVNLDKQREQKEERAEYRTGGQDKGKSVRTKTKKKKRGSVRLPFKSSGKKKTKIKEKKRHGLLKFVIFLIILAVLGTAAYYNRETLKKWAKIGIEKINDEKKKDAEKDAETDMKKDTGEEPVKEIQEENPQSSQKEEEGEITDNSVSEENTLDKGEE